jgi:hypothetical protein
MLTDEVAVPGVDSESFPSKREYRIKIDGEPARFMTPVLEKRLTGLEQLLWEIRVEPLESGQEKDSVASTTRD